MTHTDELPQFDPTVRCTKPDCVWEKACVTIGYGIFGGGIGPYTICDGCGVVLTKSQDLEGETLKWTCSRCGHTYDMVQAVCPGCMSKALKADQEKLDATEDKTS